LCGYDNKVAVFGWSLMPSSTGIASVYESIWLVLYLYLVYGPVAGSIKLSPLSGCREH